VDQRSHRDIADPQVRPSSAVPILSRCEVFQGDFAGQSRSTILPYLIYFINLHVILQLFPKYIGILAKHLCTFACMHGSDWRWDVKERMRLGEGCKCHI